MWVPDRGTASPIRRGTPCGCPRPRHERGGRKEGGHNGRLYNSRCGRPRRRYEQVLITTSTRRFFCRPSGSSEPSARWFGATG